MFLPESWTPSPNETPEQERSRFERILSAKKKNITYVTITLKEDEMIVEDWHAGGLLTTTFETLSNPIEELKEYTSCRLKIILEDVVSGVAITKFRTLMENWKTYIFHLIVKGTPTSEFLRILSFCSIFELHFTSSHDISFNALFSSDNIKQAATLQCDRGNHVIVDVPIDSLVTSIRQFDISLIRFRDPKDRILGEVVRQLITDEYCPQAPKGALNLYRKYHFYLNSSQIRPLEVLPALRTVWRSTVPKSIGQLNNIHLNTTVYAMNLPHKLLVFEDTDDSNEQRTKREWKLYFCGKVQSTFEYVLHNMTNEKPDKKMCTQMYKLIVSE